MNRVSEPARRRILALLGLGIVALLGRALAGRFGAPATVERGLYLFALGCLVAAVLVIATD